MNTLFLIVVVGSIFSLVSLVFYFLNSYRSVNYVSSKGTDNWSSWDVTIIVPVYNEEPSFFERVIQAISIQGSRFVVVGDGCDYPYSKITREYKGRFVSTPHRGGKRKAVALGMQYVETPFFLLVDSDTIIPPHAVDDLLSSFDEKVGGVGGNLKILMDKRPLSYAAEFVERSREVVLKAMNTSGSAMILDGGCAMYRTDLVKPFILSDAYTNYKVLGKPSLVGDDRQLTSFVISQGYRAVKNYNVNVLTPVQKTLKSYVKQQIRWSRNGWYYFFKDLFGGTARKAGAFYTFELIYLYVLPFAFGILTVTQLYYFLFTPHFAEPRFAFSNMIKILFYDLISFKLINLARLISAWLNVAGLAAFGIAISNNMSEDRRKTFIYAPVGLTIMFFATMYGFLTFWKQKSWMTR